MRLRKRLFSSKRKKRPPNRRFLGPEKFVGTPSPLKKPPVCTQYKPIGPTFLRPEDCKPRTRRFNDKTSGCINKTTPILIFYPSLRLKISPSFTGDRSLISKQRRPRKRNKRHEGVAMGNITLPKALPFSLTRTIFFSIGYH